MTSEGSVAGRGLAPITQAALWTILNGFLSSLMVVFAREATAELHPFVVTFFRCFVSFLTMLPWMVRSGASGLKTTKVGFYSLRGFVSFVSMSAWFYGVTLVPIAIATALNFTAPLFATAGAALILGETVRIRRWAAVALGFVGVLVILRPGVSVMEVGLLFILLSAGASGMNSVTVKYLARTESPATIVAYMTLYLTPHSLIPALFTWSWPSLSQWGWLLGLGVCGTLAHFSTARAYRLADASACAPFEFLRLPVAAVLGYFLFAETLDLWTWVGAAVIAGSTLYVAHREAKVARDEGAEPMKISPLPGA